MAAPKMEAVSPPMFLGEGPHWDQENQVLYFVDLPGSTVHKYNPTTKKHTSTTKIDGGYVTFVLPVKGKKNQFAIGVGRNLSLMTWNTENSTPTKIEHILTIENEPEKSDNRFNDGKADPQGKLWAGTMGPELSPGVFAPEKGALYSISKDLTVKTHIENVGISNGLAWSKDLKHFYYADSQITKIFAFDFDAAIGQLSNRRSVFDFEKHGIKGFPDGMTIDIEDKLWVACYDEEVIRVDPLSEKVIQRVSIPSPNITSVAFGGRQLDELYVTTGTKDITPEQKKKFPNAGALFKVSGLGVKGLPGVPVNL